MGVRQKSEIPERLKQWKREVEAESGSVVQAFRSDNGTEFTENALVRWMKDHGTKMQVTAPDNP